jgi:hypothetical protein
MVSFRRQIDYETCQTPRVESGRGYNRGIKITLETEGDVHILLRESIKVAHPSCVGKRVL